MSATTTAALPTKRDHPHCAVIAGESVLQKIHEANSPAVMCVCAEANGLSIAGDTLWTRNVRGFWKVGTFELLFRKDSPKQSTASRIAKGLNRVRKTGHERARGGGKCS
jgi:hypothetical protein